MALIKLLSALSDYKYSEIIITISVPDQYKCNISRKNYRAYYLHYNQIEEDEYVPAIIKDKLGYCQIDKLDNCTNFRHKQII